MSGSKIGYGLLYPITVPRVIPLFGRLIFGFKNIFGQRRTPHIDLCGRRNDPRRIELRINRPDRTSWFQSAAALKIPPGDSIRDCFRKTRSIHRLQNNSFLYNQLQSVISPLFVFKAMRITVPTSAGGRLVNIVSVRRTMSSKQWNYRPSSGTDKARRISGDR